MPTAHEMYDAAVRLKDQGDLPAAIAQLKQVLEVDPKHTDTHSALAVYLQRTNQFDEAIQHAQKVVELLPNDAFSYTQLSVIYMRCGRIPEAEEAKARAHAVQMGGCGSHGHH